MAQKCVAGGRNVQVKMFIPEDFFRNFGFLLAEKGEKTTKKANKRISSTQRASKNRNKKKTYEKQYQAQTTKTAESFKEKRIS